MRQKTKTKKINFKVLENFKVLVFSLSLVSILSYLIVVNHTNTMGIEIGEMQYKIEALQDEYRDLQNVATELQSMQRIESISNLELSMVRAETYEYLASAQETVAAR